MRARAWRLLAGLVLPLAVSAAAVLVLARSAAVLPAHQDEGRYVPRARFFHHLFIERDLGRERWGDGPATHTQPMLTNYIVGGWIWARGYDVRALEVDRPARALRGSGTGPLGHAREPFVLLGAGAILCLYLLGRALSGPLAGLVSAALALGSPLAREQLVTVRSEAPLVFLTLLALLLAVAGVRRGCAGRLATTWAVALGLALGLAFATKLTGLLGLGAIGTWGALMAARAAASPGGARVRGACLAGRGWALAVLVALGVFVLVNPHLYPDPLRHTGHLLEYRAWAMAGQRAASPHRAIDDPLERAGRVLGDSLIRLTATGGRGLPVEAGLAAIGCGALLLRSARRPVSLPDGLAALTVLTYFVGTAAGLQIAWDRYFLPTLLLGTLLSGLGLAALAPTVARHGRARVSREEAGRVMHGRSATVAGPPPDRGDEAPAHAPTSNVGHGC